MPRFWTYAEASAEFKKQYAETIASGDKPAIRQAWSLYVDWMHRDGQISKEHAYNWQNPVLKAADR